MNPTDTASNHTLSPRDAFLQAIPKLKFSPHYKVNPRSTFDEVANGVQTIQIQWTFNVLSPIPKSNPEVDYRLRSAEAAFIDCVINSLLDIYTEEQLISMVKSNSELIQHNKAAKAARGE